MRLTKEQRRELANIRDEDESDIVAATRDLAACILRLDEEAEPVHPSHLTTVVEHLECERDEALARLASAERNTSALHRACAKAVSERDEVKADHDALARAVGQALMVPTLNDREELVDPSDHAIVGAMLGMRNARDTALARLAKVEAERDEARNERDAATARMVWAENARGKTLLRLYDVENQAKRVARAERWYGWAWLAHREVWMVLMRSMEERTSLVALNEARDALDAERRKLAEMVGEGDES